MEQSSSRSSENAWRFVPESDRTFSSKYKIQNCKTDDILSVSYKQSSKSDNRDGEVFVIDENRISEDDAQVWNIDERKDNKILISDASKPSFYLNVISNSKIPRIRDVVSTKRDDTDSESIVFTFEEFKNWKINRKWANYWAFKNLFLIFIYLFVIVVFIFAYFWFWLKFLFIIKMVFTTFILIFLFVNLNLWNVIKKRSDETFG